jgi:hypothetical protein
LVVHDAAHHEWDQFSPGEALLGKLVGILLENQACSTSSHRCRNSYAYAHAH